MVCPRVPHVEKSPVWSDDSYPECDQHYRTNSDFGVFIAEVVGEQVSVKTGSCGVVDTGEDGFCASEMVNELRPKRFRYET